MMERTCSYCKNALEYNNDGPWCFPCTILAVERYMDEGFMAEDCLYKPEEVETVVDTFYQNIKGILKHSKF